MPYLQKKMMYKSLLKRIQGTNIKEGRVVFICIRQVASDNL